MIFAINRTHSKLSFCHERNCICNHTGRTASLAVYSRAHLSPTIGCHWYREWRTFCNSGGTFHRYLLDQTTLDDDPVTELCASAAVTSIVSSVANLAVAC